MSRYKSRSDLEELNKRMGSRPQVQKLSYQLAVTKRMDCELTRRGPSMRLQWRTDGVIVTTKDMHFNKFWATSNPNWWHTWTFFEDHDLPRLLAYIAATGGVRTCKLK